MNKGFKPGVMVMTKVRIEFGDARSGVILDEIPSGAIGVVQAHHVSASIGHITIDFPKKSNSTSGLWACDPKHLIILNDPDADISETTTKELEKCS